MNIVVDAGMTASLFLNLPYSASAEACFRQWRKNSDQLHAPAIWPAEMVSFLSHAVKTGLIKPEDALTVLGTLPDLLIRVAVPDPKLLEAAFLWTPRITEVTARDAQYLALAEHLGATYWTTDQKLVRVLSKQHLDWVMCCIE